MSNLVPSNRAMLSSAPTAAQVPRAATQAGRHAARAAHPAAASYPRLSRALLRAEEPHQTCLAARPAEGGPHL
jgi:hypothetical protein